MKWLRTLIIFDKGNVVSSTDWGKLHASYLRAIASVDHPNSPGKLTLRRKKKNEDDKWERNGVGYLRTRFLGFMRDKENWTSEGNVELNPESLQPNLKLYPSGAEYREPIKSQFGDFDFSTVGENGTRIVIEWETGNISSSHRSLNKLAIGLGAGTIQIGVLIVPSGELYEHLTDRIGNIEELSPYLSMWESLKATVAIGLLAITVVEHDELTDALDFPYLKSGADGNSSRASEKKGTPKKVKPKHHGQT